MYVLPPTVRVDFDLKLLREVSVTVAAYCLRLARRPNDACWTEKARCTEGRVALTGKIPIYTGAYNQIVTPLPVLTLVQYDRKQ